MRGAANGTANKVVIEMSLHSASESPRLNGASESPQLPTVAAQAILEVLDGVHRGVMLPLDNDAYSIGSKPDADIMLADDGVAPEHGVVRLHGRTVIIEAAGGDIGLGRGHRIPHWHRRPTTLPVELGVGKPAPRIGPPRTTP